MLAQLSQDGPGRGGPLRLRRDLPADGYVIDPERVAAAITPRTKAIILNSPGNPTGAVQPDEVQAEIGRIAARHGVAVISDEIYEHLTVRAGALRSFSALAPDARDLTLIVTASRRPTR